MKNEERLMIACADAKESTAVQEKLMKDGWAWRGGDRNVARDHRPFLLVPATDMTIETKIFSWISKIAPDRYKNYTLISAEKFLEPKLEQLTLW